MDKLIHVKVSPRIRQEMDALVEEGLFENHAEMVREGLRDLVLQYPAKVRPK
jgi:Arc/MetJ-type ribon-helix-helix transcriptional regulator